MSHSERIQEAAKEIFETVYSTFAKEAGLAEINKSLTEGFAAIISKHIPEQNEWVKVTDELKPPRRGDEESISVDILLYVPAWANRDHHTPVVLGNYLHSSKQFRPSGSMGWEKEVTHWQPLPAPPRSLATPSEPLGVTKDEK